MKINDTALAMLTIQLSVLGQTNLRDNDREMLQTLEFLLEQALGSVRGAIVRPDMQYRTIDVTVMGIDIPVEVEYDDPKTDDELYELAKEQLRRSL